MDLLDLEVQEKGFLHFKDADGELMYQGDEAIGVDLYSIGSKEYQKAKARANKKALERYRKKGKLDALNADEQALERAEFLSDCTIEFKNLTFGKLSGKDLSMAIYLNAKVGYLTDQVDAYLGDWSNFTKASTAT